jgi:hypothetical protein
MEWRRRRRHSKGPVYWNTSWGWPTSWGLREGRSTYNVTRHRLTERLPFRLGSLIFGGRRR